MGFVSPAEIGARARRTEDDGWDGLKIYDTQCMLAEAFVMATAAALATEHLQLSFSTSNPVTRHPSVAAAAITTLTEIAGPRISFGIGRGDSACAYVGGAPATVSMFERYVHAVRRYLHGEPVPFDDITEWRLTDDVSAIQLAHAPAASSLLWPDRTLPPAPIEVYATGPRVLGVGGRHADRVALGIGADVDRLRWAMDTARAARAAAGGDPDSLSFLAIVSIAVHDDIDRARRAVVNMVASQARFSVMSGRMVGPVSETQREVYEAVGNSYDMERHGQYGSQTDVVPDSFIDELAIVGSASRCIERIQELAELGIDAFMLAQPQGDADPEMIRDCYRACVDQVIPQLR